ncbi:MAG: hypothetical protein OES12_14000 [Anaerolineae bacterium]|nr:hypothetical protein [Anaerolineae bacterium]
MALIVNGWGTGYDYFSRWANEPTVHKEYDGPLIDLARYLIAESYQSDILLPFSVYAQPTTRFLLYDEFREISDLPMTHSSGRRVLFVDPKTSLNGSLHHVRSSSYVWLTRNEAGDGLAYISRQPPPASFALKPIGNTIPFLNTRTGGLMALLTPLESLEPARPLFTEWPPLLNPVSYEWKNQFLLIGYDVSVDRSALSHNLTFNLYWQLLADAKYDEYDFLIEILNRQGISMGQTKYSAEELFRWRASGAVISTNRGMEFSPPLAPGTYTIQLSVLQGGEPAQVSFDGRIHGRQAVLGTFEINEDNLELRSTSQ